MNRLWTLPSEPVAPDLSSKSKTSFPMIRRLGLFR